MTLMSWRLPTKRCVGLALVLLCDILIYWISFVASRHPAFENHPIYQAAHHLSKNKGQAAATIYTLQRFLCTTSSVVAAIIAAFNFGNIKGISSKEFYCQVQSQAAHFYR
jgi:Mn2+/Fe2+ NRAMP family transporter